MNSIKRVAIFSDHHERVLNQLIEKSKNREFAKLTSAISIKDIMLKRVKNFSK